MNCIKIINRYFLLLLAAVLMLPVKMSAQNDTGAINRAFSSYQNNYRSEKLFVHTDKELFVAGEMLWFKIYAVDAASIGTDKLSKIAYIELLDSLNKPVLQAKISLIQSAGNGSFYLPIILNSGNYRLRAYTNWMQNFDAAYYFEKNITIINVQKNIQLPQANLKETIIAGFFPEGGNLVNDLPCKVAFKVSDRYGKGRNCKGFVLDNKDTLLAFASLHAGMGAFTFTPVSQHVYSAYIITDSGETMVKELPAAYTNGYAMQVHDSAGKVVVTILGTDTQTQLVYLFVHTRGIMKLSQPAKMKDGKAVVVFEKSLAGDGISVITIFNEYRKPVCERLTFKQPENGQKVLLQTDKQNYLARRQVTINIKDTGAVAATDTLGLSLSVHREEDFSAPGNPSVEAYLLLSSDLKGYVENPGYYFEPNTAEAADNLMLTNGWRRFKWEEVFQNNTAYFKYAPEYNGAIIHGVVKDTTTGNPAPGIEMYSAATGYPNAFKSSTSGVDGNVAFEIKNLYGAQDLIFQTKNAADSEYKFTMQSPFSSVFDANIALPFTMSPGFINELHSLSISMQVQNIYSAKNLRKFATAQGDTIPFYRQYDAAYLLDDYTRYATLEEVLREYVKLVDVKKREGSFHYSVFNFADNEAMKDDPLVLLDGVPVKDFNKFMQADPLKLYKLEVVNRKYFYGSSVFNGILNWTSYRKDLADYDLPGGATVIDYDGLQQHREFYAPEYDNEQKLYSHLPDYRNVLLWVPDIQLAPGAHKEITFYASDVPGNYVAEIQGISPGGKIVDTIHHFTVSK